MISIIRTTTGEDSGGFSLVDPPGPSPSKIPVLLADNQPLYTFAAVGHSQLAPLVATVPIAFGGFENNGMPRLFEAETDPATGAPRVVFGPGGCFVPTNIRINDPATGQILPEFAFQGQAFVGAVVIVPAGIIPHGFDFFSTIAAATNFQFAQEFAIPQEFFDHGSQAFAGTVRLKGVPIGSFQDSITRLNRPTGRADTVIERKQDVQLSAPLAASGTTEIEMVRLSLRSQSPIKVTVGKSVQYWDVHVSQSPTRPSTGKMTIRRITQNGGTFDSELLAIPVFRFVRHGDGAEKTLDLGAQDLSAASTQKLILRAGAVPWQDAPPPDALDLPGATDGFWPGTTGRVKLPVYEQAAFARHGVNLA